MPVVINEFEIITEQPSAPQGQEQTRPAPEQEQATLRPEDIERIQRHFRRRLARIHAV